MEHDIVRVEHRRLQEFHRRRQRGTRVTAHDDSEFHRLSDTLSTALSLFSARFTHDSLLRLVLASGYIDVIHSTSGRSDRGSAACSCALTQATSCWTRLAGRGPRLTWRNSGGGGDQGGYVAGGVGGPGAPAEPESERTAALDPGGAGLEQTILHGQAHIGFLSLDPDTSSLRSSHLS